MASSLNGQPLTLPRTPRRRTLFQALGWGLTLAVLVWSWQGAEIRPLALIKDAGNMAVFARDFFPPNFHDWPDYLQQMIVTVQIAIWGTALAVIFSIPFGILSSDNLVPWYVYQPVRRLSEN